MIPVKTTFSMILERVCAQLHTAPLALSLQLDQPVTGISLCDSALPPRADTLYIAASIPEESGACQLILLSDAPCACPGGNFARLPATLSPALLLAAAQDALTAYARWGDHVLDMIYTGKGLDAIVSFAYETFKNPILIYDSSLKVLAYTRNDGSSDRMWRDTVQQGSVNSMNADEAREFMSYVTKLDNSVKPFKHTAKDLTDPFYNGNILIGGQRVGMVDLMERNHPVTQGEIDLLEAFCYLLSFELQKDSVRRENSGLVYHQLIVDLLDGNITDSTALDSRLNATRWKPAPYTRVVLFRPQNAYMAEPELRRAFEHLLTLSAGRGILRENEIVLLLACREARWSDETRQLLDRYAQAHQLRCGVSDAYDNLLDTRRLAPQPAIALSLSEESVALFDSVRFDNLLNLYRTQPYPPEYLHPAVLQLAAYDRQHGTEYLITLEALLHSQHNQMLAARALHIHRTTLIYRLQKMSEMTGLRLDDAQDMLFAHFSLCIYRSAQRGERA